MARITKWHSSKTKSKKMILWKMISWLNVWHPIFIIHFTKELSTRTHMFENGKNVCFQRNQQYHCHMGDWHGANWYQEGHKQRHWKCYGLYHGLAKNGVIDILQSRLKWWKSFAWQYEFILQNHFHLQSDTFYKVGCIHGVISLLSLSGVFWIFLWVESKPLLSYYVQFWNKTFIQIQVIVI